MPGVVDLVLVGKGFADEHFSPEDAPPQYLELESAGLTSIKDEDVCDARWYCTPFLDGPAVVAGKIVGDHVSVLPGRTL